jgi:ribosome-binding factor A
MDHQVSDNSSRPAAEPSTRIQQLNSLVQQEVAVLLQREIEFTDGAFVTISRVEVAPDAESAKVWLSVFPEEKSDAALELVNRRIGHIQSLLNKRLVMKFVPKLTFVLDHAEEKVASLNALLNAVELDPTLTPVPKNGILPPETTV